MATSKYPNKKYSFSLSRNLIFHKGKKNKCRIGLSKEYKIQKKEHNKNYWQYNKPKNIMPSSMESNSKRAKGCQESNLN